MVSTLALTGCMEEIENIEINEINLAEVKAGEYIGERNTTFVKAKVKVIVEDHEIVKVDILKHEHGKGEEAEQVVDRVIKEQTTQVDVVSGATGSSKVILKAIEKALKKGVE
jgi:uncharacterized protein with FMN-binding domain